MADEEHLDYEFTDEEEDAEVKMILGEEDDEVLSLDSSMSIFIETSTPWPGYPDTPYGPRGISPILSPEEEVALIRELARQIQVPAVTAEPVEPTESGEPAPAYVLEDVDEDPTVRRPTRPAPAAVVYPARERRVLVEIPQNREEVPPNCELEREIRELSHNSLVLPRKPVLEEGEIMEEPSKTSVFDRLGPKPVPLVDPPALDPEDKRKKKSATPKKALPLVPFRNTYETPDELEEAMERERKKRREAAKKRREELKKMREEEDMRMKQAVQRLKDAIASKKEEKMKKEEEKKKKRE